MLTIIYSTKGKIIEVIYKLQIANQWLLLLMFFFGILCSTLVSWITATPKLFLIRLVFTSSRVGVVRGLWTQWKLKNQTLKNQILLITPLFMIKWKAHSLSCKQKCKNPTNDNTISQLQESTFSIDHKQQSGKWDWHSNLLPIPLVWFPLNCMTLVVKWHYYYLFQKNIELKVTVEKLKKELVERQELLVKASWVWYKFWHKK